MIRTLIIDRADRVLLQADGNAWGAFYGEQRADEAPQQAVDRIIRDKLGIELPFFTKLLETEHESWYLVALDTWPPVRNDLLLVEATEALGKNLEYTTRYVLEWFMKPAEEPQQMQAREAAEA